MPIKSMSPMPMQSKIGDASLKFGPDWLRALSSDSSTSSPTSPWTGGSGGGGGTPLSNNNNNSPSGGGGGGNGFSGGGSNHHQGYHQHQSYNSSGGGYSSRSYSGSSSGIGTVSASSSQSSTTTNRNYKPSEFRYSREEFLSLYDKNLSPPEFLPAFGTLFIEKMQPPLAFSQPSEDELRIWHIPQPESSRQANMSGPPIVGRGGYAIRGRGSGIERGRGRGRGGYYGRPPYEEEERVTFSRPRGFERSLSAHDRASWAERNGTVVGGQGTSPPDDGGARGGGSWRNKERDSWGPGPKRLDDDDGWRKPRWRRDDEDDGQRRRLHKSWSEDGAQDNLPEWAKDSTDERGTFDSSGAFHEEDGYSAKTNAFEKRRREERERSNSESESFHGSHNDRVQKKTPDRNSMKAVIPPSLKEEADESPDAGDKPEPSTNRSIRGSSKEPDHKLNSSSLADSKMNDNSGSRHKADLDNKKIPERNTASTFGKSRNSENEDPHSGKSQSDSHQGRKLQMDEDQYLDMTEEASSLVAKLIDEDGPGGAKDARSHNSSIPMMVPIGMSHSSPNISIPNHGSSAGPNAGMNIGMDRISPGVMQTTPPPSIDSMETWFYRDPQGNVQGPFRSTEMHQWFAQGYFTGGLLLRRECDKIFITLYEMGKLYDRNPFDPYEPDSPPPPPIMEPQLSALEQEAQFQQKQQLLQQQLREQKYLLNMNQNVREPPVPDRWGSIGAQQVQQQHGGVIGQGPPEVTSHAQAQMILNLVKNAGANVDPNVPNPLEHLQAMFNRQAQAIKGGEPQNKSEFVNSLSVLQSQLTAQMEHQKSQPSVASNSDAMQSLIQQLQSLSTQQQMQKPSMPKTTEAVGSAWGSGQPFTAATPQMQAQMPWMQQQPNQNSVWEYRDQMMKLQQQKLEDELRRKKLEEDKDRKRMMEEEERRREEQKRAELEEEKRKMIEEQLKEKYLLQKKQQEEIMKRQAAELDAARRREEEKRLELEEEKRKALMLQEQLMQKKQEEMMRQHQEMERARIAEMQRQQYEQQKLQEQRLQEQHRLQEQQRILEQQREQQIREEEQRRQQEHEELQRREREQREDQHRREREELQRREQQKFTWNSASSGPSTLPINQTRTLLEIQQEEAVKQQEEIVRQQVLKKKQQQQQQEQQRLQQQNSSFKWAQAAQTQKVQAKSFAEIQAEEAAKLAQQQEKERETRAITQHHSQQQQMWTSSLTWANRASLNAPNTSKTNGGGGAWGDASSSGSSATKPSNKSQSQFPTVQQTQSKRPAKESDDNLMKLFQEHNMKQPTRNQQSSQSDVPEDEFTRWCFTTVKNMANPGMDVPIFINFLKEVESPFEVNDYIGSYLGDGRDAREFGKEFLERRSRWRNANKGRKDSGGLEDNLCRPASAVNPVNSEFQEVKGKKGKKGKMQKVDSRILGFTTNADRNKRGDYGDDSTD